VLVARGSVVRCDALRCRPETGARIAYQGIFEALDFRQTEHPHRSVRPHAIQFSKIEQNPAEFVPNSWGGIRDQLSMALGVRLAPIPADSRRSLPSPDGGTLASSGAVN